MQTRTSSVMERHITQASGNTPLVSKQITVPHHSGGCGTIGVLPLDGDDDDDDFT